ncbi:Uncharacterised protein [Klebsiella pneumoniae]|nr:Uncharacterised protein [Klebsiella pneumoniae]
MTNSIASCSLSLNLGMPLILKRRRKDLTASRFLCDSMVYVVAALGMAGPSHRLHPDYLRRLAVRVMREMFDIIKL